MGETFSDITRTIGSTPLVRLNEISKGRPATILAKLDAPVKSQTLLTWPL